MHWLPEQKIREYYQRIDAGDVEWVIGLFAPDARYLRADEVYDGHDTISYFYRKTRKIRGSHVLETVIGHGPTVIVCGVFQKAVTGQQPERIGFCDIWQFNPAGQIAFRQTYLAMGGNHVRE